MRIKLRYLHIFVGALLFVTLFFGVPVFATEVEGEYLGTLGPGETISTRNIAYGIIEISPTSLSEYGSWCSNCSRYGALTTMEAKAVSSKYSVCVDGFSVFDYSSVKGGTAKIDFSTYSNCDSIISMPADYKVTQTITCRGGQYDSGGTVDPCGYSTKRTINVTGVMQLYGYDKKPVVVANPQDITCGTDKNVSFSVTGDKTVGYRWQIENDGVFCDIKDGTDSNSVGYFGSNTPTLSISNTRCAINGTLFRCILIGERGDEVSSEVAAIYVNDTSAPKVKLSYSPAETTYDSVSILINASDADSGLCDMPYFYNGESHNEKSFKVNSNGSYIIKVSDKAGNVTEATATISNITSRPVITPAPTPAPTTQPTVAPSPEIIPTLPVIIPTPKPTPKPTINPKANPTDNEDKKQNSDEKKTVIKPTATPTKLPNKYNEKKVNINKSDYDLNLEDDANKAEKSLENVENTEMLSEAPMEEADTLELKDNNTGDVIGITVGILLALLLILFAMIFPVRIEHADELGTWHFCALKMLSFRDYSVDVGLLLEDFDRLRLHFGGLFLLIAKGHEFTVHLEDSKTIVIDEIEQNLIVDYNQVGRD